MVVPVPTNMYLLLILYCDINLEPCASKAPFPMSYVVSYIQGHFKGQEI